MRLRPLGSWIKAQWGAGATAPVSPGETSGMLDLTTLLEFWLGLNLALAIPFSFFKEY